MSIPDWLRHHDGSLRPGLSPAVWFVLLSGHPQYRLEVHPADGKFTCSVIQTVNGKRLDMAKEYPTVQDALNGGLEELRNALGW